MCMRDRLYAVYIYMWLYCVLVVRSFVEVVRYLTNLPGVTGQYVLSECFSQDPLENYFGQLRACGGRCENPTVKASLESAQSLRVQGSLAMEPVRGNSSRKRRLFHGKEIIDDTPLPKRRGQKKWCVQTTTTHSTMLPASFEDSFIIILWDNVQKCIMYVICLSNI